MNESSSPERRGAPRLNTRCKVSFRVLSGGDPGPKQEGAETLNISATGLCLLAPQPLPPDTDLALELALEGQGDPILALGRVVWCDSGAAATPVRVGIAFRWVREEDGQALEVVADYVRRHLEE